MIRYLPMSSNIHLKKIFKDFKIELNFSFFAKVHLVAAPNSFGHCQPFLKHIFSQETDRLHAKYLHLP